MCSETASTRFSFSHDVPPRRDTLLIEEFEFNTNRSLEFESSSADELFSNGLILPIQIQDRRNVNTRLPPRPSSSVGKITRREVQEANSKSKSTFWGGFSYSRSKSLNCDTKKSFICSSSPPLPRSKSTGSAANLKKMNSNRHQQHSYLYPVQKSSSCKGYGNGHRISPVLNMPTPNSFSKLFGFGSLLRVGKAKKNSTS